MSREGDWICSLCQHLNFKRRDSCQQCQCPKYGGGPDVSPRKEVLAGDWYCNVISCGAHNYASRASCFRCGASKNYCSGLPGWKDGDWVCPRLGCGAHNYASRTECFQCRTPR